MMWRIPRFAIDNAWRGMQKALAISANRLIQSRPFQV
jgi:hypothetical protein